MSKTQGEEVGVEAVASYPSFDPERLVMEVRSVCPGGALDRHNRRRSITQPATVILEGDLILAVNGVRGDFQAMLAQFAEASVVFVVRRAGPGVV